MALLARHSRKPREVGRSTWLASAGAAAISVVAAQSCTRRAGGSRLVHLIKRDDAHHQLAT